MYNLVAQCSLVCAIHVAGPDSPRSGAGNIWGLVRDDLVPPPGEVSAETT